MIYDDVIGTLFSVSSVFFWIFVCFQMVVVKATLQ